LLNTVMLKSASILTAECDAMSDPKLPHVLILGGGFAGLWATRALASAPVRVTLVDRTNHHLFQPLLYQVATAGLSAPDIAAPLRHILRKQRNVTVRLDEVQHIDPAARTVRCAGGVLGYDYLIVAVGATHSYFGHDDWAAHAPGLKTLDDAFEMRRRILCAFEAAERESDPVRRAEWLSFVVIGAGPTGVELAGTLAEIARHTLPAEFRHADPSSAEIHLVEAGPKVLAAMPDDLSASARRQLEQLGVTVHTGEPVTVIDAEGITLGGKRLACRTVLWAAGVAAAPLGSQLGVPLDRAGRVLVAPDLSVPGHPEIFVAGDLAHIDAANGRMVPGVAPAAKQMGNHVARVIRDRLVNRPGTAFQYRDFGNLATIGRMAAVVEFGRVRFSGMLAWWFWLVAHIFFLIGFRNRISVLINWAWSYWTYQRAARIISSDARENQRKTG
jgi:NADH:ubiquinone reductase (H+-translocating)